MHTRERSKTTRARAIAVPGASSAALEVPIPKGFEVRESTLVLEAADANTLKDPRALQAQQTVRANIVLRRTWTEKRPLDELAVLLAQQLAASISGIADYDTSAFTFDNGLPGYKVSYRFQPVPMIELRQIHVIAVDAEGSMHFTLTVGVHASAAAIQQHLAAIAATRLTSR